MTGDMPWDEYTCCRAWTTHTAPLWQQRAMCDIFCDLYGFSDFGISRHRPEPRELGLRNSFPSHPLQLPLPQPTVLLDHIHRFIRVVARLHALVDSAGGFNYSKDILARIATFGISFSWSVERAALDSPTRSHASIC
jgi:hypothetical protein